MTAFKALITSGLNKCCYFFIIKLISSIFVFKNY
jgi:hypothetical protein